MNTIKIHNLSNLSTQKYSDFIPFQDDFKIDEPEKNKKLQNRIKKVGFKYPLYAWSNDNKLYTLDAHQRLKALKTLENEGSEIPEIPFILIHAENENEAKKEILFLNSRYAEIDVDSNFIDENFDSEIDLNVEIPELEIEDFENTDYSDKNQEIVVEEFSDKMILKFDLSEDEHSFCMNELSKLNANKEIALLKLLKYEQV